MNFDLAAPCADCPFRREGGVRVTLARAREIARAVTGNPGATFACHKTTGVLGNRPRVQQHCVGALLFADHVGSFSQFLRIAGRLGAFDLEKLEGREDVFETEAEMVRASL